MNREIALSIVLVLGGCAAPLKIDSAKMSESAATLEIESPELASYITVPLMNYKYVNVTLWHLLGCDSKALLGAKVDELGKARLTPKSTAQSVQVPAGMELAIYGESNENLGGNLYRCGQAVRFVSEPGATYRLHFRPHGSIHGEACDLQLTRVRAGVTEPVPGAFLAIKEPIQGLLKGGNLNLCWREDHPP